MTLFYASDIQNQTILSEPESLHLAKVPRLKEGDVVWLSDGKGVMAECRIEHAHAKHSLLQVIEKTEKAQINRQLHIAISPLKTNDRFDWFLEKSVEFSVASITPVISKNTERVRFNHERASNILIAAMKQSLNPWLPELNAPVDFKEFCRNATIAQRALAHCDDGNKLSLNAFLLTGTDFLVCIGPEGDFSPEEIEFARSCQFSELSLGNNRLRAETAGISVAAYNYLNSPFF